MKILLVSLNTLTVPYPVYPLGLDYVAHAIEDDHDVTVVDLNNIETDELIKLIGVSPPDVIGLSLRNVDNTDVSNKKSFLEGYRLLVQEIRNNSSAVIVLGGAGYTIFPREILEFLKADYGVAGEGERFKLLLESMKEGRGGEDIPGIIRKNDAGPYPSPWQGNLRRSFDPEGGHLSFYLKNGGGLNLQSKRGCPFKCIYCTYPHIEGTAMRKIDPDIVASDALSLEQAGGKYFFITDSAFNADYSHSAEVARAVKKVNVTIPWGAFFAPTTPPEDYYPLMAESGLTHVEFGTESLSDNVLKQYGKPFKREDVKRAHNAARDAGLHIAHYFLLGGPGENSETIDETLEFIESLDKAVFFFFCGMRIYPNTRLYDIALEEGQISRETDLLEPVYYNTPDLTSGEIMERVHAQAKGRLNWIVGSGDNKMERVVKRMYKRGFSGPLWEFLIQ